MNVHASPRQNLAQPESTLAMVLAALFEHDSKPLVIHYDDGRTIQPGYHVTEVKAGSFVTLDCGGNADAWKETILQVEDIPADQGRTYMTAGKFRAILAQVDRKVRLDYDARLTIEVGPPGTPMQVFDVAEITVEGDRATMRLAPRPAICKPRHRAELQAQSAEPACCAPAASGCCA